MTVMGGSLLSFLPTIELPYLSRFGPEILTENSPTHHLSTTKPNTDTCATMGCGESKEEAPRQSPVVTGAKEVAAVSRAMHCD